MPKFLVKQSNGRYCHYSTVVDSIVVYNMTKDDVAEEWRRDAKRQVEWDIEHRLDSVINEADRISKLKERPWPFHNWDDVKEIIDYDEYPDQREVVEECEKV